MMNNKLPKITGNKKTKTARVVVVVSSAKNQQTESGKLASSVGASLGETGKARALAGKPSFAMATAGKYFESVGRRKTAIARVRFIGNRAGKSAVVNNKSLSEYFRHPRLENVVMAPIAKLKLDDHFEITAVVSGGGYNAQAEAIRHGLSRALVLYNPELKKKLRKFGFLTRDPRMAERKKYGLKKARRAPQWAKR